MDAISDLHLFGLIARLGTMAAAAQELGVTPPVVSRRLAALEGRLGVRLLNRTTRRLSLTPDGEVYLADGARILEQLQGLEHRLGSGSLQPQGILRIGATLGFGRTHLASVLSRFTEEFAGVEVQLHLTDKAINLVDQGFDLVIRFGEAADSRLTARLLANNRRLLCASPAYIAQHGKPSAPRELGTRNCIFIREADETFGTWHLKKGADVETVKVRSNLSSNDGSAALSWALEGRGILLRSQWDIAEHVRAGRLVPVLPDWQLPPADIYAVFQTTNRMPAKVRAMVDRLVNAFEPMRKKGTELLGAW